MQKVTLILTEKEMHWAIQILMDLKKPKVIMILMEKEMHLDSQMVTQRLMVKRKD